MTPSGGSWRRSSLLPSAISQSRRRSSGDSCLSSSVSRSAGVTLIPTYHTGLARKPRRAVTEHRRVGLHFPRGGGSRRRAAAGSPRNHGRVFNSGLKESGERVKSILHFIPDECSFWCHRDGGEPGFASESSRLSSRLAPDDVVRDGELSGTDGKAAAIARASGAEHPIGRAILFLRVSAPRGTPIAQCPQPTPGSAQKETRMSTRGTVGITGWLSGTVGAIAVLVAPAGDLGAVDFLRADANSDGDVSIADAYYTFAFLFAGGNAPECGDALDTDGNGRVSISDGIATLYFLVNAGEAPAAPFPEPGPLPGPGVRFPCESYGNGGPLEDPAAALEISAAVADGGDSRNASITLAVSSSVPLGGLYAEIVDEAGVIEGINEGQEDVSKSGGRMIVNMDEHGQEHLSESGGNVFYLGTRLDRGVLTVGYVTSILVRKVLPAGEDAGRIGIEVCLKPGTEAGEYPLTLRRSELIAGCRASSCGGDDAGRAIEPEPTSGVLVVSTPVSPDAGCTSRTPPPPPVVDPPDEPPPPPPPPPLPPGVELAAEIRIGSAEARPGDAVELPYIINSNGAVEAFSFSVDFDEEVLQATEVEALFLDPDSLAVPFWQSAVNNSNDSPGNEGVDEGYVIGAAVPDLLGVNGALPPDTDNTPVILHFTVTRKTTSTSTILSFLDGGRFEPDRPGVQNNITAYGVAVAADQLDSIVLINGLLNILPDVSAFFLRGDANGDRELNITDPQFTLNYLFVSANPPPCLDAADANDDGSVNVTDPIATLQVLFQGQSALPEPFGTPGVDPTEDTLGCLEGVR